MKSESSRLAAVREYVDLAGPVDPELEAVVRLAAAATDVPTATINLIDATLQRQLATYGFERGDCAREDSMCHTSLEVGGTVVLPDATQDPRFASGSWVDGRLGSIRFYAAAPLVTPEGQSIGTLCVYDSEPRQLHPRQVQHLEDLAALLVALFDRGRRARREAELARDGELARTLQAELLPGRLPVFARTSVAARYTPQAQGAQVGGDWYDALPTDDGTLVFVIGDVQGHNSHAAALMGQVRTAVRAYVSEGHSPSAALERTNALLVGMDADLFATCCVVELDERTGSLEVASAGHPAPALLNGAEGASLVQVEPGPPLGVEAAVAFPATSLRVEGPARLLLYTYGVVEARDGADDERVETLLATLRRGEGRSGQEVCDVLLAAVQAGLDDDAALLLVDYAGRPRELREAQIELPADMRAVSDARNYLRLTMAAWDLGGDGVTAELVVSELVTNALLHTGSTAVLTLRHDPATSCLALGVDDCSTRHPQPRESDDDALGGRGMHIVEAVSERWWVAPRGDGKTVWAELALA